MTAAEILRGIRELSAVVVGDVCLDRWCHYDPAAAEPSRETGIPRTAVVKTSVTPGAAGTVAGNLAALGARHVAVLGVVGEDGFGWELNRALQQAGISGELTILSPLVNTFTYTKLINLATGQEDQPRVDFINAQPMPPSVELQIVEHLRRFWSAFDVVLVSDQAETAAGGVVTPAVRDAIAELAAADPQKVVWVDSRMRGELFRNVIVKVNEDEAALARARAGVADHQSLRRRIGTKPLIVTHGRTGALIIDDAGETLSPTRSVENPVDICGAGDSFSAGAALALAITGSPLEAVRFGNMVSSITIMKKGTGTASPAEVLAAEHDWPTEHA